jgi:hypothetical protein
MNESPDVRRSRRAWLWWALGILTAGVLVGLILPLVHPEHTTAHSLTDRCRANIHQLSLACHLYADDGDGAMPAALDVLFPNYVDSPRRLKCAGDKSGASSSYTLVPGLRSDMPGGFILLYETSIENHGRSWQGPENHSGPWRRVAHLDGSIDSWWADQGEAAFQQRLAEQADQVRNWKPLASAPTAQSKGD